MSLSHYNRKILQVNSSSSSFDTSQPSFIALLCVIAVLTVIFLIIFIIICYRYYSYQERKLKNRHKYRNKFRRILSLKNNNQQQQSIVPNSITPRSDSLYSVRSSEQLFSNHQNSSINTLPSRRLQQSMIDAYLNDINSFQPKLFDVKQLNSYLFIDLHSTSSETYPDNISKQFINNTITNDYHHRSIQDENQRKQQRNQSNLSLKQTYGSRFLMRERSLANNIHKLPQLRQVQQQKNLFKTDDTNISNISIINQDLQLSNLSTTTDNNHAYHVNQNQIIQTNKEEKLFYLSSNSFHYEQEPYVFERVSTSHGDDSDIQIPNKYSPIIGNGIAYMNDSIIV